MSGDTTSYEELFSTAAKLEGASRLPEAMDAILTKLEHAVIEIDKSFSGSWLGYHSRVYYADLEPAPPGANFSQEWGLKELHTMGSRGDWQEFDRDIVKQSTLDIADNPDLAPIHTAAAQANRLFERAKSEIVSILTDELDQHNDGYLGELKREVEKLTPLSKSDVAEIWSPKGAIMTRDMLALGQSFQVPPHLEIKAEATSIRHSFDICQKAAEVSRRAASHIERKARRRRQSDRVGTNVFIGHGRSPAWRELKDFVQERLKLPWDEFNRVPVAGVTNITRLSEMLDAAGVAFIIMTAEDEMADGEMQARMNVIHEVGLFQGRLGFTRAIVLVEEGCQEFSNIEGLGQIRFPKGNISAAFEQVRLVLEREGVLGLAE